MPISHLTSVLKVLTTVRGRGHVTETNVQTACPLPKHLYKIISISTIYYVIARPGQQILKSPKLVYITIVLVKIHFVVKNICSTREVTQNVKVKSK